MTPLTTGLRVEFDDVNKISLMRVLGRLTDVTLRDLYERSRNYSPASFSIVDFSAVTEFAVSSAFIQYLANQRPALADARSLSFIVAPQSHVFGLCRMFQILGEGKLPLLEIVHTLDEAFIAMGIKSPHFEPSVVPA
jgi:hypothetical protein